MGRNAWLNGDPFAKQEKPGMPGRPGYNTESAENLLNAGQKWR